MFILLNFFYNDLLWWCPTVDEEIKVLGGAENPKLPTVSQNQMSAL